jgi:Secretion system C-terminal sorting domain
MNKVYPFFLLLIMTNFFANAQSGNESELILSSNSLNANEYYTSPLKITNDNTVIISGTYRAESYLKIVPKINTSVILKPITTTNFALLDPLGDGVATVIKVKPPGGSGGLPQPKITIFPNPVQTDLNFSITNSMVSSYTIYDQNGVLKTTQTITPSNSGTINVSSLTNSTYILRLNINNGQQLAIQFIKN